ncbi:MULTISPECIES: hypothetical protein [Mycobacterium]|uniref:YbaB/EbfC family nucleoid-associated protein n=2 Tax=Mycobacterium TaxID=1763 RepID=A0A7Z7ILB6_9MYCO|nr:MULTISPECIES: hypothetical protein [Mycobacterium]MCV7145576.1 hypothetical protein [Mycobacterium riyadhense]ORW79564.1 hypothetical protein AWC22_18690 [Mycobacterium riyadhense]SOJ55712.1 hypothetical protein MSIMFB_03193 [Mycobacterium simulans]VTP00726.1 hypothetical protein BIN_B_03683 [Mycobacterium riyadhense]
MSSVNPEVQQALDFADKLSDRLMSSLDQMRTYTAERVSKDREIAVKVDMNGELVDLWLKPGVLDRKTAAAIAKDISRLAAAASEEAAAEVLRLYRESDVLTDQTADAREESR